MNLKKWLLTRFILLIIITGLVSNFYIQDSNHQYQKGRELTKESYLNNYEEYRAKLLSEKDNLDVFRSTFLTLITMSILIGIYEGAIFLINLFLKKAIRAEGVKSKLKA